MEAAMVVVLAMVAVVIAYPKRVKFYSDRVVMATGWCPRCWNHTVVSVKGEYVVCTHCRKR